MTDYSCMQESDRLTQSLAELIIDNTPNGILVLDKNFSIKDESKRSKDDQFRHDQSAGYVCAGGAAG